MVQINPERVLNDLQTLRQFGATGTGVVRPTYTPIDLEAREWLAGRLRAAGLEPTIDGVGNVLGRSPNSGPRLLLGSHSDTQPTGGWLDGVLGVIYGLEAARALREDAATRHLAVDVVSWADEESTFLSFLGSRSFCGFLSEEEVQNAVSRDGRVLVEALRAGGLLERPRLSFTPGQYRGYVEAHIEQGPYLEMTGKRIGVVTSIVGSRGFQIRFMGQQNHAGTTPMTLRRDAGMRLIQFAHELNIRTAALASDITVWTIGRVSFEPGASSIVPGKATMAWQFRDQDEAKLDEIEAMTKALIAEFDQPDKVAIHYDMHPNPPLAAKMDPALQEHLAQAAAQHCPADWVRMPSGAAHDAQVLARRMPSAMLFIPSINGISHSFDEDSHEADIVLGSQVMATAAASILLEAAAPTVSG